MADPTATTQGTDLSNILQSIGNAAAPGATAAYLGSQLGSLTDSAVSTLQQYAQYLQQNLAPPDLLNYVNQQVQLAQQGQIDPATVLSGVQQKSAMYGVQVPQNFTDAVNSTLNQLGQVAQQGYTPVERAGINAALANVAQVQTGYEQQIGANQAARGQYGGGQALQQNQQALQGIINNASGQTNQIEANAYTRALQALQAQGQLGLTAGNQSFNQQGQQATAQDAVNAMNAQLTQQANAANAQYQQQATLQQSAQQQARDLANQQANLTLNTQNTNAAQQTYANEAAKANSVGSELNSAAGNAGALASHYIDPMNQAVAATTQNLLGNSSSGLTGTAINGLAGLFGSGTGSPTAPGANTSDTTGAGISNDANTASGAYQQPDYYNWDTGGSTYQNPFDSNSDTGSDWSFGGTGDTTGTGSDTGFKTGGAVDYGAILRSLGGHVDGPGTTTSDSIPVKLSNKEYVINAQSAQKYKPLVQAINQDNEDGILSSLMSVVKKNKPQVVMESDSSGPREASPSEQKALHDILKSMSKLGA